MPLPVAAAGLASLARLTISRGLSSAIRFGKYQRLISQKSQANVAGALPSLNLTVKVEGLRKLDRALRRTNPKTAPHIIRRSVSQACYAVQRRATQVEIIRGGKQPPHPSRVTSRTGTLRRSIAVDLSDLRSGIGHVGTALGYGAIHELGLGRYPVRAYLKPAAEYIAPQFHETVYREWMRSAYAE